MAQEKKEGTKKEEIKKVDSKVTETKAKKTTKKSTTTKKASKNSKAKSSVKSSGTKKGTTTATKSTANAKGSTSTKKNTTKKKSTNTKKTPTKKIEPVKKEEIVEEDIVIDEAENQAVIEAKKEERIEIAKKELEKDIKTKKKLPKGEERKLNSIVFQNLCVGIAFMIYLLFMLLGFINIKDTVFIVDLKVFSFTVLIIAILLFERAYKKDSGTICIFGIETLVLSIATMILLYVNIQIPEKFLVIVNAISILFAVYYVGKSIILYTREKKKYFMNNMKEIIKKEEKE